MNILLVDDEAQILQVIGDFLADCGYESTTAGDGAEALKVLEERDDIDLVISDIRMPRMSGIEFLKAARVRFPGVPVILLTGHGDEHVAITALQEGAQDYLKKPIKFEEFLGCIEQVEERNRLEMQILEDYQNLLRTGKTADGRKKQNDAGHQMIPATVLVVDEEEAIRRLAEETLAALGCRVQIACTGEEGLELFAETLFDIVITEIDLPGIDGIQMIQHIRASDPTAIPIVITQKEDPHTPIRALEAGARSFLTKPFTSQDLKLRIDKAIRERKRLVDTRLLLGDLIHVRSDLQQKVVQRERYLHHLIDAAPFGILSTDNEDRILTFNGRAEQMYGYAPDKVVGQPLYMLVSAEGQENAQDRLPQSKAQHRRKDGQSFPVLVHRRDILDERDRVIARLHVVEDLTEREQMESQLLYAQRLSLLGQLAPRIAHEFKTPLQIILGQAEMALLQLQDQNLEGVHRAMQSIPPAGNQMLDLVQEMARLGKPEKNCVDELDLKTELQKILDTLKPLGVVKYCKVECDFDDPLPKIQADPAQIEQVFRNLIVNAAHAMEKKPLHRLLTLTLKPSPDGSRLVATVGDTGQGIPSENLEQIFEPFFTTKPEDKGTGLGLPIVKTILDRHDATIDVQSQVDKGTCFTLSFPALQRT